MAHADGAKKRSVGEDLAHVGQHVGTSGFSGQRLAAAGTASLAGTKKAPLSKSLSDKELALPGDVCRELSLVSPTGFEPVACGLGMSPKKIIKHFIITTWRRMRGLLTGQLTGKCRRSWRTSSRSGASCPSRSGRRSGRWWMRSTPITSCVRDRFLYCVHRTITSTARGRSRRTVFRVDSSPPEGDL